MRLRPFLKTDLNHILNWIPDRRTHALWAADRIAYPLTDNGILLLIRQCGQDFGAVAWTCTDDGGVPIGFFLLSINEKNNTAFVAHVLIDPWMRGKGYGTKMMKLLLKYSFEIAGVNSVSLSVFDANPSARRCYEKAGFMEVSHTPEAFVFEKEKWGRSLYTAAAPEK